MKYEFRDLTEIEAEYLSREFKIPVAQAKEWFGHMTTICNVPWIENNFGGNSPQLNKTSEDLGDSEASQEIDIQLPH